MSLSWTSQPGTITEGSAAALGSIVSDDPSVTVSGIPVGATLTDGTNVFVASGATTSVSIAS